MNTLRFSRIVLLLQCLIIFLLSSISEFKPVEDVIPWFSNIPDIAAHFVLYFILASAAWFDFQKEIFAFLSERFALASVIFSTLYGVSDEIHQLFVPGRHFEIKDMVVDFSAAVTAVIVLPFFLRKFRFTGRI